MRKKNRVLKTQNQYPSKQPLGSSSPAFSPSLKRKPFLNQLYLICISLLPFRRYICAYVLPHPPTHTRLRKCVFVLRRKTAERQKLSHAQNGKEDLYPSRHVSTVKSLLPLNKYAWHLYGRLLLLSQIESQTSYRPTAEELFAVLFRQRIFLCSCIFSEAFFLVSLLPLNSHVGSCLASGTTDQILKETKVGICNFPQKLSSKD